LDVLSTRLSSFSKASQRNADSLLGAVKIGIFDKSILATGMEIAHASLATAVHRGNMSIAMVKCIFQAM
jgi:hypothetical protein